MKKIIILFVLAISLFTVVSCSVLSSIASSSIHEPESQTIETNYGDLVVTLKYDSICIEQAFYDCAYFAGVHGSYDNDLEVSLYIEVYKVYSGMPEFEENPDLLIGIFISELTSSRSYPMSLLDDYNSIVEIIGKSSEAKATEFVKAYKKELISYINERFYNFSNEYLNLNTVLSKDEFIAAFEHKIGPNPGYSMSFFRICEEIEYVEKTFGYKLDMSIDSIYQDVYASLKSLLEDDASKIVDSWNNSAYKSSSLSEIVSKLIALNGEELAEDLEENIFEVFKLCIDGANDIEKVNEIKGYNVFQFILKKDIADQYANSRIEEINQKEEAQRKKLQLLEERKVEVYSKIVELVDLPRTEENISLLKTQCGIFMNLFNGGKRLDESSAWENYNFISEDEIERVDYIYNIIQWYQSPEYQALVASIPTEFLEAPLYIGHNGYPYKDTSTTLLNEINTHDLSNLIIIATPTGIFDQNILIEQIIKAYSDTYSISMEISLSDGKAVIQSVSDDTYLFIGEYSSCIINSKNFLDIEKVLGYIFSSVTKESVELLQALGFLSMF